MLAGMSPQTIARMRFPLGELTKDRVRAIAAEHGLPVASKPDSQDLCFLAGTGRARFLERHGGIGDRPGAILDRRGNVLGRHRGAHRFTVGQRRGLEVGGAGEPLYVHRRGSVRSFNRLDGARHRGARTTSRSTTSVVASAARGPTVTVRPLTSVCSTYSGSPAPPTSSPRR